MVVAPLPTPGLSVMFCGPIKVPGMAVTDTVVLTAL